MTTPTIIDTATAAVYRLEHDSRRSNERRQLDLLRTAFGEHDACETHGIQHVLIRTDSARARIRTYHAAIAIMALAIPFLALQNAIAGFAYQFISVTLALYATFFMTPLRYAKAHVHFAGAEPSHACVEPLNTSCLPFARAFVERFEATTRLPTVLLDAPSHDVRRHTDFRCERRRPRLIK